jgi:hypothetical protein
MDADELKGLVDPSAPLLAIETMLGYARSIRTTLWFEIDRDCRKVGGQDPSYDLCTESCFP